LGSPAKFGQSRIGGSVLTFAKSRLRANFAYGKLSA
jgi:hypothetical protein